MQTRLAPAANAPSSSHIVWACMRYAASVRYQSVTLSDLCAAAGVSERRVRDAFTDCYGMSPTAYLRVVALLEVRRTLLDGPSVRDAVTRAASDFGFWHLSRFAGQYRALFGESPSKTLARARALRHPRFTDRCSAFDVVRESGSKLRHEQRDDRHEIDLAEERGPVLRLSGRGCRSP